MGGKALIVVSLQIDVEKENEFNDFYHHVYIPKLMKTIPEVESIWRFQEHNVEGSLRYYRKQFLTFYECREEKASVALDAIRTRPGREEEQHQWKKWQASHFHNLESASIYLQRYAHPRTPWDGNFGGRPFFMVSVEIKAEEEPRFNEWYETHYLPKNLADVPTWAACRRYSSQGRTPAKHLTIYEAWDLQGLTQSLELMRSPSRMEENLSWKAWDCGENPPITWEDATCFKPIFRYP